LIEKLLVWMSLSAIPAASSVRQHGASCAFGLIHGLGDRRRYDLDPRLVVATSGLTFTSRAPPP
jgi:hypothetical protein